MAESRFADSVRCVNLHRWGIRRRSGDRLPIEESFQFQERLLQDRPRNDRQHIAKHNQHRYRKEGIPVDMYRLHDVQRKNFVEQIEAITNDASVSGESICENGLNPLPLAEER